MPAIRNFDGTWELRGENGDDATLDKYHPAYKEALPRYLTALDHAFFAAKEKCEFEFLLTMFRVRGIDNRGIGDAYETTLRAIPLLYEVHDRTESFEAARHLQLWIYGHIVEASEPYEILSNLVNVALGERFSSQFYPYKVGKSRPQSPSSKIKHIEELSVKADMLDVVTPLKEIWDRNLRNAIFHSDYILHGGFVHTQDRIYSHDEIMTIVNRAIVYHESLANLYNLYIHQYSAPTIIPTHPDFSHGRAESAVVIVRQGHGAVGLKDAWTKEELAKGKINWRIGIFTKEELSLLNRNPELAILPQRHEEADPIQ